MKHQVGGEQSSCRQVLQLRATVGRGSQGKLRDTPVTKIQLSSLAPWPEIYICDTFPSVSPWARHKSVCLCTHGSAHPVEWPLCLFLAVPPWDVSIPSVGCLAPKAHSSASVCPGRKQLPCGGDGKSRANTLWISASGQINFNLNCHHKGPFFPSPFLWVVSLIYISEWGRSPFGAKFSFFIDFRLQNAVSFLVNVVAVLDLLGGFVLCCFKNQRNSMMPVLIGNNLLVLRSS